MHYRQGLDLDIFLNPDQYIASKRKDYHMYSRLGCKIEFCFPNIVECPSLSHLQGARDQMLFSSRPVSRMIFAVFT